MISIHALREEGDKRNHPRKMRHTDFYPRPPRGGRQQFTVQITASSLFLSTPSARRATQRFQRHDQRRVISIHALREEGDCRCWSSAFGGSISIHALREEGDARTERRAQRRPEFLSTPSARRATAATRSIFSPPCYFYPRPPRGGRRKCDIAVRTSNPFLSTPSARRATRMPPSASRTSSISIHALREEGDEVKYIDAHLDDISIHALREEGDAPSTTCWPCSRCYFYPRPPRGGRLLREGLALGQLDISIHALREEGDSPAFSSPSSSSLFLSTPSARRATSICALVALW